MFKIKFKHGSAPSRLSWRFNKSFKFKYKQPKIGKDRYGIFRKGMWSSEEEDDPIPPDDEAELHAPAQKRLAIAPKRKSAKMEEDVAKDEDMEDNPGADATAEAAKFVIHGAPARQEAFSAHNTDLSWPAFKEFFSDEKRFDSDRAVWEYFEIPPPPSTASGWEIWFTNPEAATNKPTLAISHKHTSTDAARVYFKSLYRAYEHILNHMPGLDNQILSDELANIIELELDVDMEDPTTPTRLDAVDVIVSELAVDFSEFRITSTRTNSDKLDPRFFPTNMKLSHFCRIFLSKPFVLAVWQKKQRLESLSRPLFRDPVAEPLSPVALFSSLSPEVYVRGAMQVQELSDLIRTMNAQQEKFQREQAELMATVDSLKKQLQEQKSMAEADQSEMEKQLVALTTHNADISTQLTQMTRDFASLIEEQKHMPTNLAEPMRKELSEFRARFNDVILVTDQNKSSIAVLKDLPEELTRLKNELEEERASFRKSLERTKQTFQEQLSEVSYAASQRAPRVVDLTQPDVYAELELGVPNKKRLIDRAGIQWTESVNIEIPKRRRSNESEK